MKKNIGIIGLGRTGMPAAMAYLSKGYEVYGYDKRPEVLTDFKKHGGIAMLNPEEVARLSDIILVLVLNDDQVKDVFTADHGILNSIKKGSIVISMSTINRSNLETMAELCSEKGIEIVDCPFTGGPARITDGSLTLIASAPDEVLKKVTKVLEEIGRIVHVGKIPGMGQSVKHCNQLLVGVTHAATMEVITLARKMGLDPAVVSEVIEGGIAGSDYFRLLSESVLKNKPSPGGLGQMCKDISIVVNTLRQVNMPAYVATAASRYFSAAEDMDMLDREGADLIEVVESISGNDE
jgi:3-hydroxyisobutyrate dehydrogenase-like beta-hydroxyacid dehydrogenase